MDFLRDKPALFVFGWALAMSALTHSAATQSSNSPTQNRSTDSTVTIHGNLAANPRRGVMAFKLPSTDVPRHLTYWHQILSVKPNLAVTLSADRKWLELALDAKLPKVVEIEVASQLVPKSDAAIRMNQIQLIGTHNSYHIAPDPSVMKLIKTFVPEQGANIEYTHRTLSEQLDVLGMRKFEIDIYHDIKGGSFARPLGAVMSNPLSWKSVHPEFDADAMNSPGMKVIHFPNFDFRSTTPTLSSALAELSKWSRTHNLHLPIMILIETKQSVGKKDGGSGSRFDAGDFQQLDKEIMAALRPDQLITPDQVRGRYATLNQAIRADGWPLLGDCRGKFLIALDNPGRERVHYLKNHPGLRGAPMFVSSPPGRPEAAFLKINNPISGHAEIQKRIQQGYLIRTRADADLTSGRSNSYHRMNLAFSSGAQFISTDFPEKVAGFSDYSVQWKSGEVGRLNPQFNKPKPRVTLEPEVLHSAISMRRFVLKVKP
jgi:hypothetical protein